MAGVYLRSAAWSGTVRFLLGLAPTRFYACRNFVIPDANHAVFQHESVGAWDVQQGRLELRFDGKQYNDVSHTRELRRCAGEKVCKIEYARVDRRGTQT
jgi:hypothetical protein